MGAINPPNKRRERAVALALQDRIAAKLERELGRILAATYRDAARAVKASGTKGIDTAVSAHNADLKRALTAGMVAASSAFVQRTLSSAQGKAEARMAQVVTKATRGQEITAAVSDFIKEHVATRVEQIDDTTRTQIQRIVERGQDSDFPLPDIADEIESLAVPLSGSRAKTIAQTETHTVSNKAAMITADTFDIEMVKEWVAVRDDRTRDAHEHANGQQVAMDASFNIGGDELEYPGDPHGLPENTINCRCAVVFVTK